jgi:hypothetical protein
MLPVHHEASMAKMQSTQACGKCAPTFSASGERVGKPSDTRMIIFHPKKFRLLRKICSRSAPISQTSDLVKLFILGRKEMQYLNALITQGITFIRCGVPSYRSFRCFVVVNFSCLFGERFPDILAVFNNGLNQLPVQCHRLNTNWH